MAAIIHPIFLICSRQRIKGPYKAHPSHRYAGTSQNPRLLRVNATCKEGPDWRDRQSGTRRSRRCSRATAGRQSRGQARSPSRRRDRIIGAADVSERRGGDVKCHAAGAFIPEHQRHAETCGSHLGSRRVSMTRPALKGTAMRQYPESRRSNKVCNESRP
jgi:hypothetical protein